MDVILRSHGRLMLQINPLSGLIFLVGVLLGSYIAGKPQIGLTCLLAVISANVAAYLYQLNRKA
ncbi:urea transporter [Snodgrassella alvi]|uniref:urea transporter n=1 Tax=Snodgrassella alvi TaxID=1196083 RepID=UPI0027D4613C|nr:urea transporter [Snodgrassella alvi]